MDRDDFTGRGDFKIEAILFSGAVRNSLTSIRQRNKLDREVVGIRLVKASIEFANDLAMSQKQAFCRSAGVERDVFSSRRHNSSIERV